MKRYERQITLSKIGISGQYKLAEARVLIIGVGGLGCPVLQNLVAAGVGKIGIVDGDVVEETNLHRQYLYTLNDIGTKKVVVAQKAVLNQNPNVEIISYSEHFNRQNCFDIVSNYQIIVDCTDSTASRYLINDIAVAKGIPMVYASVHKFEGQLSVFNFKNGPTYRCLFPEGENLGAISNCNDSGVLGVLPTILGAMQANEVLKIILEIGDVSSGKLLLYSSLDNIFETIEIQINNNNITNLNLDMDTVLVTDFFKEVTDENSVLIDIRETFEEPKLDLEKIKNIPLSELDNFLLNINKNQKIILICQHGNRSALAVDYLKRKGFNHVFHLQNGIESLEKINYDIR